MDSGKLVDMETLSKYTGSPNNVFNYDRNAEFARVILDAAEAANKARCVRVLFICCRLLSQYFDTLTINKQ